MKVLWLSHLVPYPPKGGVLQRSYNLIREVARHCELHLLAFVQRPLLEATAGSVDEGLQAAELALGEFCASQRYLPIISSSNAVAYTILLAKGALLPDGYSVNWLKSPSMQAAVRHRIAEADPALVHFDTLGLAPYRSCVGNRPTVLDHHNIESHMMLRRIAREPNYLKRFYFFQEGLKLRSYERRVCPGFNLNITCSDLDGMRLQEVAPDARVETIPNGVDTDYFSPSGVAPDPDSLVFAGRLNWYPNQEAMRFFADKVWPLLKSARPTARMHVLGANPPEALTVLAQRDPDFLVHGFVDDVRPFIDRAAVYVCPIQDGGGTKLKVIDALAMGKPLVADPIACEGLDVTNGRDVVLARTPDEYVSQIVALFDDPGRRLAMGEAARALALERYAYPAIGRRLAELYEQLVLSGCGEARDPG